MAEMPGGFANFEDELKKCRGMFMTGGVVCLLVGVPMVLFGGEGWKGFFIGLLVVAGGVFAISRAALLSGEPKPYTPLKGYGEYRKTPEELQNFYKAEYRKAMVIGVPIIIALSIFFYFLTFPVCRDISMALGLLAVVWIPVFKFLESNIKFSAIPDDACLMELKELGLISEGDEVLSLYKDFQSWDDVREGCDKILVLTRESLVVLDFMDKGNAKKFTFPLSGLEKLGIRTLTDFNVWGDMGLSDSQKRGKDITCLMLGFKGHALLRLRLKNSSNNGSLKVFISLFLRQADACILQRNPAAARQGAREWE
jgi:hypothetical protein